MTAVVNAAFSPELTGTGLATANRLKIILAGQSCGVDDESSTHVERVSFTTTGTATALTFGSLRVKATGSYKACWWVGVGVESVASYAAEVASLTVTGPATSQSFVGYNGFTSSKMLVHIATACQGR